jgi:hypothetical protein
MERAATYAPFPREFPTPRSSPVWRSHKLQYALTGGYYTPSSSASQQQTTTSSDNRDQGFVQVPDNGDEP